MEEVKNPLDEFPPEVRQDVEGLLYLGYLTDDVSFCGHVFGIRTLRTHEEVAAGVAIQHLRGTLKEAEAYVTAQIGLALTHVDGDEDFCPPIGPDKAAFATARYNYVAEWFWPTTQFLYTKYTALLGRQITAIRAVQDLPARSLGTFLPSPDSLNDRDTSPVAINPATLPDQF